MVDMTRTDNPLHPAQLPHHSFVDELYTTPTQQPVMILRRNHTHQKTRPAALKHTSKACDSVTCIISARFPFLFPHHSIAPAFMDGGGTLKQDFRAFPHSRGSPRISELARSGSGIVPIERLRTTWQALRSTPRAQGLPVLMSLRRDTTLGHPHGHKKRDLGRREQKQRVAGGKRVRRVICVLHSEGRRKAGRAWSPLARFTIRPFGTRDEMLHFKGHLKASAPNGSGRFPPQGAYCLD